MRLRPAPALTCKPEPSFRWLDALDQPYSQAFRESFSYADADVVLRYAGRGPAFEGTLRARKLKPNFAYQVKLVGMPPSLWGEEGHAPSNRRIGEVGRWWRPGEDGHNAYLFEDAEKAEMEGYILFDYFVTDAQGRAETDLRLDSSFHVLWKTSQWPPAERDSEPTHHTVVAEGENPAYERSFPRGEFGLYAEHQYGRPPIGQVRLEPGHYRCFLLLTEESFHAWGNPDGGDWAAALAAPVEFTITEAQQAPEAEDAKQAE